MAEIVKEAIAKLRRISAPVREIATWYEANPGKLYLSPELEYLRGITWITLSGVGKIIGMNSAWAWCKPRKSRFPGVAVSLSRGLKTSSAIFSRCWRKGFLS